MGPLDRAVFKPYELRRFRHEHLADETHGFWKRVGDWVAQRPRLAEAMEDVLTPAERDRVAEHVRPLVEEGRGVSRLATAYLWAIKPSERSLPG